jgi:hypothetical protein
MKCLSEPIGEPCQIIVTTPKIGNLSVALKAGRAGDRSPMRLAGSMLHSCEAPRDIAGNGPGGGRPVSWSWQVEAGEALRQFAEEPLDNAATKKQWQIKRKRIQHKIEEGETGES